jgi:hypothetical protein
MNKIAIIVTIMIFCFVFVLKTTAIPKNDLVLYYSFDASGVNGNTAKDLSGNGNNGTINGGAKIGGGFIELDGKDGYVVTPALQVRTNNVIPFTAICRFKTNNAKNGPLWMWGDNAKPSSSGGAEGPVGWRETTGNFCAGFYMNAHFYAEAQTNYADNNWHIVAQVGEDAVGHLYVDGKQIASTTAGYVYAAPPYFLIGARTKNSGSEVDNIEYYGGSISMVAIYGKALSEKDINTISSEILAISPQDKLAMQWGQIKR